MNNLLLKFPAEYTPRDKQVEVIEKVQSAVAEGYKYIIIEAPTGCGKSHIAKTFANGSVDVPLEVEHLAKQQNIFGKEGESYIYESYLEEYGAFGASILTVSKALQDQYDTLFDDCVTLKGKSNYKCGLDGEFTCDFAPCTMLPKTKVSCREENICPHMQQINTALSSKDSVFNYSSFLCLPDEFKHRDVLICDEVSELEDYLVNHYGFKLEYKQFKDVIKSKVYDDDPEYILTWLNELSMVVNDTMNDLAKKIKSSNKATKSRFMNSYNRLKRLNDSLDTTLGTWSCSERVVEYDANEVSITPLYSSIFAKRLFAPSKTVILMSATIINHELFAKTLGINKGEYKYIEVDSEFDAERSPIKCSTKIKLNYGNLDNNLPILADMIEKICEHHSGDKGLIHTHSMKITNFMKDKLEYDPRFLFREPGVPNDKLIEQHYESEESTVLVSPSLAFGTDLADDMGRFQIIVKAPFLPLGSKRIKILFDRNKKWYENKTLTVFLQMCGRCTRNKDDHSVTYVLDGTLMNLIKRNYVYLPKHFKDRIY